MRTTVDGMIFKRTRKKEEKDAGNEDARFCVALFYSTSLAIRAEKIAKNAGLEVKLIPTPRHLSSNCGTALRFHEKDRDMVEKAFDHVELEYDGVFPL